MIDEARSGEASDELTVSPSPDIPPPLAPAPKLVKGRVVRRPSRTGGKVDHPKFGIGEVLGRSGEGEHEKVLVRFGDTERMRPIGDPVSCSARDVRASGAGLCLPGCPFRHNEARTGKGFPVRRRRRHAR
jgi:hypothetical protein